MVELAQISFIALVAYGHIKLYLDDGRKPLSPVRYENRVPYGIATFRIGERFVKYIDLRQ